MDYVQVRPRRPATVTILAVLSIIVAVSSLVLGVAGVVLGAFVVGDYSGLGAIILLVLGTVVFAFGILEIIYSIGFLEGKGWSSTLGMTIAVVCLVSSIGVIGITAIAGPGLTANTSPDNVIVLPELIIISTIAIIPITTSSVTIILLTRPHVKAFLGNTPAPQG